MEGLRSGTEDLGELPHAAARSPSSVQWVMSSLSGSSGQSLGLSVDATVEKQGLRGATCRAGQLPPKGHITSN